MKNSLAKSFVTVSSSVLLIMFFYSFNISEIHAETVDECTTRIIANFARDTGRAVSSFTAEERQNARDACQEDLNSPNPAPASSAPANPVSATPGVANPTPANTAAANQAQATPTAAPVGVLPPAPVSAPVGGSTGGNPTIYTGPGFVNVTPFSTFGRVSIDRIINNVINYISGFLATIAVLSLMYGGVLYMTAGGDNGKIGKAKQVIVLTIVGLVIGSFAYMIIIFTTRLFYGS